jgi:hypothetical protein
MFDADPVAELQAVPWPELDLRVLQIDRRSVPPPFPLKVLPAPWRPWIESHAQASPCLDYIAQALLAAVAAACGSRFVVDVTAQWREPMVLWQALVGAPSTGKTPAVVAARHLLGSVEAPADPADPRDAKPGDGIATAWFVHRGMSMWHDDLEAWLAEISTDRRERGLTVACWSGDRSHGDSNAVEVGHQVMRAPVSVFGSFQADRLAERLSEIDEALSSRLLYCWPVPRLDARLDGAPAAEEGVRTLMQRLVDLPGTVAQPVALTLQPAAAQRLQDLLPRLRAFMRDAEGLEAAWIGKAAGTIVRLAGLLSLMDWAAGEHDSCLLIGEPQLERAQALWTDYFWLHAEAVFGQAASTIGERRVRRVARWLKRMRPDVVSREEVRRDALGKTVDADTAESVIERLEGYGALRMLKPQTSGGRPRRRWEVNPELWTG